MKKQLLIKSSIIVVASVLLLAVICYGYYNMVLQKVGQAFKGGSFNSASVVISKNVNFKGNNLMKKKKETIIETTKQIQISNNGTNSYDAAQVADFINKKYTNDGKKIAFLTFDDGPSTTVTPLILDTLRKNGVNATFFLIGKMVDKDSESKAIVKRISAEGNSIGNHTYSHEYRNKVPNSLYYGNMVDVARYMGEIDATNKSIGGVLGTNFSTRILRMPGGHMSRKYYNDPNLAQFDQAISQRNMYSIDWNAYDLDSDGKKYSADQLLQNTIHTVGNQEKVVILMHDTYGKEETAKALPGIIEYLKSQGYEFKTIS